MAKTTFEAVQEAVDRLAYGGEILEHTEKSWASITFRGTRHELQLQFHDADAGDNADAFQTELPDHDFAIPGQLVADASVREVDHRFGDDPRVLLTVVLLLLDEA